MRGTDRCKNRRPCRGFRLSVAGSALITTLVLAGTSLADVQREDSPPGPIAPCEGAHLVVLDKRGQQSWIDLTRATEVDWDGLERVWLVGSHAAPTRLDPARRGADLICGEASQVAIKVTAGEAPLPKDLVVVAAPLEAWQQVTEDFLPRWLVEAGKPLVVPMVPRGVTRVRLVSSKEVGDWVDLRDPAGAVELKLGPTAEVALAVVDERGRPVAFPGFTLFDGWREPAPFRSLYRAGPDGRTRIRLPADRRWRLVASAEDFLPSRVAISGSSVATPIVLEGGCDVSLRLVDWRNKPVAAVQAQARAARSRSSAIVVERRGTSGEDGAVRLGPLPVGRVDLTMAAPGYAVDDRTLVLEECPAQVDLGAVALAEGSDVVVRVQDPAGESLEGVVLRWGTRRAVSGADGIARLEAIRHDSAVSIAAEREGFEPALVEVAPPFEPRYTLTLEPQPRVVGRVVDSLGAPVDFTVRIVSRSGRESSVHEPKTAGVLDLAVPVERELNLEFRSPKLLPKRVDVPSLVMGAEWSVGEVALTRGLVVVGRVVDERGEGIAGARLWATRADPINEMLAWYQGDVSEARSDAEGRFELSGMPEGPGRVRIDGVGRARAERSWSGATEGRVDLGTIELARGATVWVSTDPKIDGTARVDPGRAWRDVDMLTAAVVAGVAEITSVPRGPAIVSIEVDGETYCETRIEVPSEGEAEVECVPKPMRVRGQVVVGGAPVGPGVLLWRRADAVGDVVIVSSSLGGSLARHRFLGGGPTVVEIEVDANGRFVTEKLSPATWEVGWTPRDGSWAAPQNVTIPDLAEVELQIEVSRCEVRGVVRDVDGAPAPGVLVTVDGELTRAQTDDSGAFQLVGLQPGGVLLRAKRETERAAAAVELGECEEPGEVVLDLEDREDTVTAVVSRGDRPAPGSLVVVETAGVGRQVRTTDLAGRVELEVEPGTVARIAAQSGGVWSLMPWSEVAAGEIEVVVPELGADLVVSAKEAGPLTLLHSSGWDLAALLRTFGRNLEVGAEPVTLWGLPPGSWEVGVGAKRRMVALEAGSPVAVDFE